MKSSRPKYKQCQLLLVLLLFLVGQLALVLHSHDHNLQPSGAEECVVCLVSTSGDAALPVEVPNIQFDIENSQHLSVQNVLGSQSLQTSSQPRAPPFS